MKDYLYKMLKSLNDAIENFPELFKLFIFLSAIVTIFLTLEGYLDSKIENKITNEKFIDSLSEKLRPFLIFNEKGIVTYNHGALQSIENINVNIEEKYIEITTGKYIQVAPLLISTGFYNYSFRPERMKGNKWKYNLLFREFIALSSGGTRETPETLFILELL